jgi:ATP-binding cassette subfamily B (MDR/TAP) protein 1
MALPQTQGSSEKRKLALDENERVTLEEQLNTNQSAAGYFTIYRYATTFDVVCIFVSILACSAGGAGGPLMMVKPTF